jgi:hypothetical protein
MTLTMHNDSYTFGKLMKRPLSLTPLALRLVSDVDHCALSHTHLTHLAV